MYEDFWYLKLGCNRYNHDSEFELFGFPKKMNRRRNAKDSELVELHKFCENNDFKHLALNKRLSYGYKKLYKFYQITTKSSD